MRATTFGVNALLTMLRSRRCLGSSMTIIDPKYSDRSGFASLMVMLGLELKMCGWRLAYQTSSYLVSAQWPGPPSTPGVSERHVERDRRLAPQRGECPVAQVVVVDPELPGAEVDVRQRHIRGSRSVHASRDTHAHRE